MMQSFLIRDMYGLLHIHSSIPMISNYQEEGKVDRTINIYDAIIVDKETYGLLHRHSYINTNTT